MSNTTQLTTAASRYLYYLESKPAGTIERCVPAIENYIYLHHVNEFLVLPQYMDSISDSTSISYQPILTLGRSAPTYVYSNSGPRTVTLLLDNLHRELMQQVNSNVSNATFTDPGDDYIDYFIKAILACAYPKYDAGQKLIDPPLVSLKMADDLYIKGVVSSAVSVGYKPPILRTNKYAFVSIQFQISEVDPYDADMVMDVGSYRNNGEITMNTSMNSSSIYRMAGNKTGSGSYGGVSSPRSVVNFGSR